MSSKTKPWVVGALVVVALVAIAALTWWAMGQAASSTRSSSTRSSSNGWSAASSVQLNSTIESFLDDLAHQVGFQVFVTSAVRTARDQARAMLKKWELGGASELSIYKRQDLVAELLATTATEDAWAAVIEEQISRGDLLSSHLSGRAFDLRTTGAGTGQLTEGQIAAVQQGAVQLGAKKVLREDTPPHLHVELPA